MTNEDLLQQAKDQVAKDAKYASWSGLESICLSANASASHRILYSSYIHKAAELAIQSAREEAYSYGKSAGVASMKHEQEIFKGEIKRLTSQKEMLQKSVKYWRYKHDNGDNSMS